MISNPAQQFCRWERVGNGVQFYANEVAVGPVITDADFIAGLVARHQIPAS